MKATVLFCGIYRMNYSRCREEKRKKTNLIQSVIFSPSLPGISYSNLFFYFFFIFGLALKGIHLLSRSLSLSTSVSLSHYTEWHAVHHPDTNLLQNLEGGEIIKDMGFVGIAASIK